MAATITNKVIYLKVSGRNFNNLPPQPTAIFLFILILMCHKSHFHAIETAADVLTDPKFTFPIANVTASVGRDAFLTCVVQDLGSYKVPANQHQHKWREHAILN
ncbi:uncharacterized protein LOC124421281 [Lucilia cuprina]|uniref:uncharacterized protein LOC124421281 n=1 Tax=Lucilia cuprina TaxID=7375 RepID=UPI001F05E4EE|nr:uncharacterized protein LOC124421281 [Lucilia cuprina]